MEAFLKILRLCRDQSRTVLVCVCSAVACGVDLPSCMTEAEGECFSMMVSSIMCQVAFSPLSPAHRFMWIGG